MKKCFLSAKFMNLVQDGRGWTGIAQFHMDGVQFSVAVATRWDISRRTAHLEYEFMVRRYLLELIYWWDDMPDDSYYSVEVRIDRNERVSVSLSRRTPDEKLDGFTVGNVTVIRDAIDELLEELKAKQGMQHPLPF